MARFDRSLSENVLMWRPKHHKSWLITLINSHLESFECCNDPGTESPSSGKLIHLEIDSLDEWGTYDSRICRMTRQPKISCTAAICRKQKNTVSNTGISSRDSMGLVYDTYIGVVSLGVNVIGTLYIFQSQTGRVDAYQHLTRLTGFPKTQLTT